MKYICQVKFEINEGSANANVHVLGYNPVLDKRGIQIRF